MRSLFESLLDDEEDIINDQSNVLGLTGAINFMKNELRRKSMMERLSFVGNILYQFDAYKSVQNKYDSPLSDNERSYFTYMLPEFKPEFEDFLKFIKRIYMRPCMVRYRFESADTYTYLNKNLVNKKFKTTSANIKKLKKDFSEDYYDIADWLANYCSELIAIEDVQGETFSIFGRPKNADKYENKFIDEFFKTMLAK